LAEVDPASRPAQSAGVGNTDKRLQVAEVHGSDPEYRSIMRPQMHWTNQASSR
jgi:hypothetical protein